MCVGVANGVVFRIAAVSDLDQRSKASSLNMCTCTLKCALQLLLVSLLSSADRVEPSLAAILFYLASSLDVLVKS